MAFLRRFFTAKILLIPQWNKKLYRDPFDYPLRSIEEVKKELENFPIDRTARIEIVHYTDRFDKRYAEKKYIDTQEGVVKMWINMNNWNLTPKQKDRLIFLLGTRYKGDPEFKIVSRQYPYRDQNIQKCLDTAYELLMEAKRAP